MPAPTAPQNLAVRTGLREITVFWDALGDATVTSWESNTQIGSAAFGGWTTIPGATAATTSATFTELTTGSAYTIKIRAVNPDGNGAESADVTAVPASIGIPRTMAAKYLTLGGTNVSNALQSCVLTAAFERVDVPHTMGRSGMRYLLSTKYSWELEVTLEVDGYGSGTLNAIFAGVLPAGASTTTSLTTVGDTQGRLAVTLRESNAARSATNPEYRGNIKIESFLPFGDSGGTDLATITNTWQGSGVLSVVT